MAGEEQSENKQERTAIPPLAKRRDHHLCKLIDVFIQTNELKFSLILSDSHHESTWIQCN